MQDGPSRDTLIGDKRKLYIQTRQQIAEELGHARITITDVCTSRAFSTAISLTFVDTSVRISANVKRTNFWMPI